MASPKNTPVHTSAAGTTVVSTTPCSLIGVNVNTTGAGSLTVTDGTVTVAIIDTGTLGCHYYGVSIKALTITQVGTADVTTIYSV